MISAYWLILLILITAAFISVKSGKLTVAAAITGIVLSFFIYTGAGYFGVAMLAAFFMLGTFATSWKMNTKEALGFAEKNKGKRKAGQVLANAGVAGIAGLLTLIFPAQATMLRLVMAASIASATADTLSSELGMLYGRNFFNMRRARSVPMAIFMALTAFCNRPEPEPPALRMVCCGPAPRSTTLLGIVRPPLML